MAGEIVKSFWINSASGICTNGKNLYINSFGTNNIYTVNKNGDILNTFPMPGAGGSGITFEGKNLIATRLGGSFYLLNPNTGNSIRTLGTPWGNWPWGLDFDNKQVWHTVYSTHRIYLLDRNNNIKKDIPSPANNPTGITTSGKYLWVACDSTNLIYMIDKNGITKNSFPTPANAPRGLCVDKNFLWHCDSGQNLVYQIRR